MQDLRRRDRKIGDGARQPGTGPITFRGSRRLRDKIGRQNSPGWDRLAGIE